MIINFDGVSFLIYVFVSLFCTFVSLPGTLTIFCQIHRKLDVRKKKKKKRILHLFTKRCL